MGGLWSDALGERGDDRYAGIERRCDALLRDVDVTRGEQRRALDDHVPPPAPEEAYYPMRAVEPHVVEIIALEVRARAERESHGVSQARDLVVLLQTVAAAARETIRARRAADVVKDDIQGQPSSATPGADRVAAATKLRAGEALHALLHADTGAFTDEARAIGVLSALDRMEIARGLPKHLKIYAVGRGYADVFGVAEPAVPDDAAVPVRTGTWLAYLTEVASAAGHPVPADARDPQNREPLAWTGVLEGFADRLRSDGPRFATGTPLGDIERDIIARLDDEVRNERQAYEAHAPSDR
jgi:hypothetical protein